MTGAKHIKRMLSFKQVAILLYNHNNWQNCYCLCLHGWAGRYLKFRKLSDSSFSQHSATTLGGYLSSQLICMVLSFKRLLSFKLDAIFQAGAIFPVGCYRSSGMLSFKRDAIFQAGCYLSSGCFKLDAIFQATDTRDIRLSFKPLIHRI